jgi:hypothetical protein
MTGKAEAGIKYEKTGRSAGFFILHLPVVGLLVFLAAAPAAPAGAVMAIRLGRCADHETALFRTVIHEIDQNIAERLKLLGQVRMHVHIDTV